MDKMKMSSPDLTAANIEKIAELFPNVVTEAKDEQGNLVHKIDFEKLKQELSSDVIDGDESYDFTWVGKKQAMVEANKPTNKTLRPCLEDSVNWDKTENLYIEGDNLEVLKILQESYLNKIKMIYIDPPYNTGNDSFIYPDDYKTNKDQYDEEVGAIDESGYRMFKNTETNGRFHSSWCSMMYPRLKLARNLLSEDGVIFISIDDNEVDNLKKMCDEIYGSENFISKVVRIAKTTSFRGNHFAPSKDYILVYAKSISAVVQFCDDVDNTSQFKKIETTGSRAGEYYRDDIAFYLSTLETRPNQRYYIKCPDGELVVPPGKTMPISNEDGSKAVPVEGDGVWRWEVSQYMNKKDLLVFKETSRSPLLNQYGKQAKWNIYTKSYLKDKQEKGNIPRDVFEGYLNRNGSEELSLLNVPFSFPKPSKLVKYLAKISQSDGVVLDFFSGSATTAHAVMQLNAEDGGKRKFIMVQLPEVCDEKSEAYKAGYPNICEIGKERIRRAGKKIVEETGKTDLDIGFRVLKLDDSNMKDVYYTPDELSQSDLVESISNIKDGRSGYDLLYQCMLDWGLELSLPHETLRINNNEVHIVNDGDLIACFDDKVSEDTIKQIADKKPLRAVFKDSSFATPATRINVDEIFKLKSPQTTIKVL
ncbi:MAG: hypothetical protein BHW56_08510 [Acetobacter sp. 46_36]|nr:MAG: hypothetical protein BHW56_08510 [Acetobacter sp. 46_36]